MGDPVGADESFDHALDQIVERCHPLVARICRSRLSGLPAADIEDAIQETFLQLAEADRSRIANVDAWLTVVALRVCARTLRLRYRLRDIPAGVASNDPLADAISNADERLWLAKVAALLPTTDLRILHALYVQDLAYDEVARHFGVSNGNARLLAYRARQHARGIVDGLQ